MERFCRFVNANRLRLLSKALDHAAQQGALADTTIPESLWNAEIERLAKLLCNPSDLLREAPEPTPLCLGPFERIAMLDCLRRSFLSLVGRARLGSIEASRLRQRIGEVFRSQMELALQQPSNSRTSSLSSPLSAPPSSGPPRRARTTHSLGSRMNRARARRKGSVAALLGGYRGFLETSPFPILLTGSEGRVLECNQAACDLYGYARAELLGLEISQLAPGSLSTPIATTSPAAQSHTTVELLTQGKQQHPFPVQCTTRTMMVGAEEVTILWVLDVSERNNVQSKLGEAERRYRRLFERLPLGLYRTTPQGEILDANPELLQILGYPDLDSLRKVNAAEVFVDPRERERESQILEREGLVREFEARWRRKDGSLVWVNDSATAVRDADGRVQCYEGALEDISARKQLEAQFFSAQKMEALGQLAGGIAHDFNNLLMVISGCSEVMLRAMNTKDPLYPDLEEIRRAGQRASTLTRQLLAFSRRQVLETRLLNLNEVLESLGSMLRRILGEDIALDLRLAPSLDPVLADPGQIEQVLVNLVVNARDAMVRGGVLVIETSETEAAIQQSTTPRRCVELSVSDTGAGMPPEVLERAFEPFFTTKPPAKGTGLGLATVYGIVKQSGGDVRITSQVGVGTTVRLLIPAALRAALRAEPVRSAPPPSLAMETVLLVEDQDDVRHTATRMLRYLGYDVVPASSGAEALELARARTEPIHVVLTDVVMPEMSGTELVETLRETGRDFKVLYMSGHADEAMTRHGVRGEGQAFLAKPITLYQLARKLREVLGSK